MNEINKTQPEKNDLSGSNTWSSVLTGILFVATCLLILGFFLQSIISVF